MKYMGSKNRHAKELLPIILRDRKPGQWYVEPFVGGANMIDKVTGNRMGNDNNEYLIALLRGLSTGWEPPTDINENMYNHIKKNKHVYPPALVGFVGIPCSYAAKWFGGYCRGFTSDGKPRDYIMEAWRNCMKQAPNLAGIEFTCKEYDELAIPDNSIVYCDPPYLSSTGYMYKNGIDHNRFWNWCDYLISQGHTVFVSEYTAPDGWECVWSKTVTSSLTKNTGSKTATEKLFRKAV